MSKSFILILTKSPHKGIIQKYHVQIVGYKFNGVSLQWGYICFTRQMMATSGEISVPVSLLSAYYQGMETSVQRTQPTAHTQHFRTHFNEVKRNKSPGFLPLSRFLLATLCAHSHLCVMLHINFTGPAF